MLKIVDDPLKTSHIYSNYNIDIDTEETAKYLTSTYIAKQQYYPQIFCHLRI